MAAYAALAGTLPVGDARTPTPTAGAVPTHAAMLLSGGASPVMQGNSLADARADQANAPLAPPAQIAAQLQPALSHMAPVPGQLADVPSAPPPSTATPFSGTPFASVPFDRRFGQRIGGAIGAAMNAITVKDGVMLLQITPERLGRVSIALDTTTERLHITAENEAVRGAIAQAHGRIEQDLRHAGQRLAAIEVESRDTRSDLSQGGQNGAQQRGHNPAAQGPGRASGGARGDAPGHADRPAAAPTRAAPAHNIFYA